MSTITIIIPAYNEENNLEAAYRTSENIVEGMFENWEIIIINDGSLDRTGQIADQIAANDSHVRVIHNQENRGFGWNYGEGVRQAVMDYVLLIPGDNEIDAPSIRKIMPLVGTADILITYPVNREIRPPLRQIISRLFRALINCLFSLNLRYFNGPVIQKRAIIQAFPLKTSGFAYQAEILTKLIRTGHSYTEVPFSLKPRLGGESQAFRLKNIGSVGYTLLRMLWDAKFSS